MTMTRSRPLSAGTRRIAAGHVLAALAGLYALVNVVHAVVAPVHFAADLGLPLEDGGDTGFVGVYASRTLVIGLLALVLVARRDTRALTWFAFLATLLPLSDAAQTASAGAGAAVVGRHAGIAAFLLVTAFLLSRQVRRERLSSPGSPTGS